MNDEFGAYATADRVPRTQRSVCAYLDLLGFSSAIREAQQQGTSNGLLRQFSHVVENWFATLGDTLAHESNEQRRREFKVFTDNVFVGAPVQTGDLATELSFVLSDIGLLQAGLIFEGFCARGAVSVGELYIDDSVVFGAAVLDAYEAEQAARAPRVVLHSSAQAVVAQELLNYQKIYQEVIGHRFTDQLLVDEDGQWFINYLHGRFAGGSLFEEDRSTLDRHAQLIASRLQLFATEPRVRAKYLWVARYHNYFCQSYAADQPLLPDVPPLNARPIESVCNRT